MAKAPRSWLPRSQGFNARGRLKVHHRRPVFRCRGAGSRQRLSNLCPDDERRGRRSGKCDSGQAGAKEDKTGNGHSEETVRSEFFTHGTPPIVSPWSNETTVPPHSQKNFHPTPNFGPG
jgi:hypothetical protein